MGKRNLTLDHSSFDLLKLYCSHTCVSRGWSRNISFGFPDQVYWEGRVVSINGSMGHTASSPYRMFVGLTTLNLLSASRDRLASLGSGSIDPHVLLGPFPARKA